MELRRMWINQPSTSQDFHRLNATNVLADVSDRGLKTVRIYFLAGNTISQEIMSECLSPGWTGRLDNHLELRRYNRFPTEGIPTRDLPAFRVTTESGISWVTSMSAHVTLAVAEEYFIGKRFNVDAFPSERTEIVVKVVEL